jgi:2-oxoglutarate dehydrogenase E1 component
MGPGSTFHRVLPERDKLVADDKVRRVVLCSGKVYYDLLAERNERGIKDIALVRLEQLYPFPIRSLTAELSRYRNADVVWCQEEPWNMGAWTYVDRRLEDLLSSLDVRAERPIYAGRVEAASPATGLLRRHNAQQAELIDEALTIRKEAGVRKARAGARKTMDGDAARAQAHSANVALRANRASTRSRKASQKSPRKRVK